MEAARTSRPWERYAWAAGILYVIALLAEIVVALGVGLTQNDSAAKIASGLHEHRDRLLVIACLSVVYATAFLIYLCNLYNLLRGDTDRPRIIGALVLVGGVLLLPCMPSATSASPAWSARITSSYTLYLMTFALERGGRFRESLRCCRRPARDEERRAAALAWAIAIIAGILLFLQGFGLGGVIASFGLILDLIRFALFLIFVLVSSVIMLRREDTVPNAASSLNP